MDVSYMVITQSAWFNGYKDMDPSLIPQFEEGDREAVARKLLDEQGVCVSLFFFIIQDEALKLVSDKVFTTFDLSCTTILS